MEQKKVLDGIRVVDLGRFIAAPFCAALLADYGADVIRVDRVGGSEDRYIVPVSTEGEGALFLQVNRNKRSITLDLDSPQGQEVLHRLVRGADIVIANMPPRTMQSLGLDYESLRKIKPDIILTASSAFGDQPAVRDRTGFDGTGQAMSGAVHVTGLPDQPMKPMVPMVDFSTALSCAFGTMMALYERKASGMGQEVGASLLRTGLNLASGTLIEEAVLKLDRKAQGNRSPNYGPSDLFRAKDGWFITQAIGPAMFKRWTRLVGKPELLDDPRFRDDKTRGENGEALSAIMNAWAGTRTRKECLAELEQARIPSSPVYSPREALEDKDVNAAESFKWMDYPGIEGGMPIVQPPAWMSRTPPSIDKRPPTPGEHTDEVLREIGYSIEQIRELKKNEIV
ncbi:CaiB/BaiF CoA transferase family protein [Ramlibacter sp.]|uniref:CaiB/BaiF CoA transferase family protein n=1 Tax=Ramlibacter sp. TaxID=1917967 RepID=UPI003D126629